MRTILILLVLMLTGCASLGSADVCKFECKECSGVSLDCTSGRQGTPTEDS